MKILKKVGVREVKRAFVIANAVRIQKSGRRYLGKISREEFLKKLLQAKQKVIQMSNVQLEAHILGAHLKKDSGLRSARLDAYNASDWYLGEVKTSEVGVWKRAGRLSLSWTNGSLKQTADKIHQVLKKNPGLLRGRARHTISNILATNVDILQGEKYLLPIIFKGGTGTLGRHRLKRNMKGDIDDGSMRSIALTVHGVKVIRAYIGFPKKAKALH